jgi:glutaredoxin|tara:strand:- start:191 stop:745 length:555 start_codon:yes stop_codon:yes gene_type:complete
MATKTKEKTKNKVKKALKNKFIDELKDKKESDRLERVKVNANLKEVILYTQSTCPYCKQIKDELDKEGVKYVEKEFTKFPNEWANVAEITQIPVFPTIKIDEDYLVPRRDFQQIPQGIQRIIAMATPERIPPSNEVRMIEGLKTLNYNMSNAFQSINQTMRPLQEFITNIQKELSEEEKEEKSE